MQELLDLGNRSLLIIVLSWAVFGATAGWAVASYGRLPRTLGVIVGVLFSLAGVAVLGIVVLARRAARAAPVAAAPAPVAVDPWGAETGFGFDTSSSSYSSTAGSTIPVSAGFGFDDYDTAPDWAGIQTAAAVTPAALAARRTLADRIRAAWARSLMGRITVGIGITAVIAVLASLASGWLSINAGLIPRFWFYPFGSGLDIALLVTAAIAAVCVLAIATRPFRWAAVLLAWVADTWVVLIILLISSRFTAMRFLEEVGGLTLTVGDTLEKLGIDTTGGVVDIPPGVDLSSIGVTGDTLDLSTVQLGDVIPNLALDIGPGLILILVFGALANGVVILTLRSADRLNRPLPAPDESAFA